MSATVEPKPTPNQRPPTEYKTLSGATLESSVPFAGETVSVRIGGQNPNCDSIIPARLEPDGSAVPIKEGQIASGLLFRRRTVDRAHNGAQFIEQCYVPMSNVKCLQYSAEVKAS